MNPTSNLNDIFADCTDFEICDALAMTFEKVYGYDELVQHQKHIPHDRWVIHTIWGCTGLFEGEGYSYFWGSSIDHFGFADALEEIGDPILAKVLRESITLVPRNILGNWDAVEAHTKSEAAREEAAELMDDKFILENPDILGQLARYARVRRHSFADVLDQIIIEVGRHRRNIEAV